MDEPTSALSGSEVEVLFRVIRELTAEGVAIVYISHHLEEALEIADHAVVFRDGALVARGDVADIDINWVISQHGRPHRRRARTPTCCTSSARSSLDLRDVSVVDPSNPRRLSVDELSLRCAPVRSSASTG